MIGNQVAEDLRRCCDALAAQLREIDEARHGVEIYDPAVDGVATQPHPDTPDAQRWRKARLLPRSWWRDAFNRVAAEGVTLDELIDAEMRRKLP